jgi:predicted transcriptional regulator
MTTKITVELPDELIEKARTLADLTHRSFDEVLAECLRIAVDERAMETLSDEEVLAISDGQLDEPIQDLLEDLQDRNREGELSAAERYRLDDLLRMYRTGMVRKSQALKVAVNRGLRPRLS